MKKELDIEQLLRWRLDRAESEAPSAPAALYLLRRARPWWEIAPERFAACVRRLAAVQVSYGYAMSEFHHGHGGHPVPTVISHDDQDVEAPARVLYVSVREGRLRLRFELDPVPRIERNYEVIFVSEDEMKAVLVAQATLAVDGEYRLDTELPDELARNWETLKVTDRMPFRFIMRAVINSV